MSRIGKKPINIPPSVHVDIIGPKIIVKGPKGSLEKEMHHEIILKKTDHQLEVKIKNPSRKGHSALWGLWRSLIYNMISGINEGYTKKLEINGIGYKAVVQKDMLVLGVGYSHPVEFKIPKDIQINVVKNVIEISGIDKQLVGQVAAEIRSIRPVEPYKGKGIKYIDEIVRRKAGKTAVKTE